MNIADDPVPFTILTEIKIIEQLAQLKLQRALPRDLQVSQFSVLNHLTNIGGPKSPAQLARAFHVTKGAMTNTISRLEAAGYVDVRGDESDGRRKLISLTAKGREIRNEAMAAAAPVFAEIAGGVGRDRLRATLPILRDLRLQLMKS